MADRWLTGSCNQLHRNITQILKLPWFRGRVGGVDCRCTDGGSSAVRRTACERRRIVELGVGIAVESDDRDSARLAQTCRRVLDTPSFRQRARGIQRRLLGLPGRDGLVAELAALLA